MISLKSKGFFCYNFPKFVLIKLKCEVIIIE